MLTVSGFYANCRFLDCLLPVLYYGWRATTEKASLFGRLTLCATASSTRRSRLTSCTMFLLRRNQTTNRFVERQTALYTVFCFGMAALWFGSSLLFGVTAIPANALGAVVGLWPMFMALIDHCRIGVRLASWGMEGCEHATARGAAVLASLSLRSPSFFYRECVHAVASGTRAIAFDFRRKSRLGHAHHGGVCSTCSPCAKSRVKATEGLAPILRPAKNKR